MLLDNHYGLMPYISPTFGIELLAPCPPCSSDCSANTRKLPYCIIYPIPRDAKVCKACKACICCNGFHCPMVTLDKPPYPPCILEQMLPKLLNKVLNLNIWLQNCPFKILVGILIKLNVYCIPKRKGTTLTFVGFDKPWLLVTFVGAFCESNEGNYNYLSTIGAFPMLISSPIDEDVL
jgi:hypothetical protein